MSWPAADRAYIDALFSDVLLLLEEARALIASGRLKALLDQMEPARRLNASHELSSFTNRATATMSVLLMAQAVDGDQVQDIQDPAARLEELYAEAVAGAAGLARASGEDDALAALSRRAGEAAMRLEPVRAMLENHFKPVP